MLLAPGEDIGVETHDETDQFTRIEQGEGSVHLEDAPPMWVNENFATSISRGTKHNVKNTSKSKFLKLYSIYSPPHYSSNYVQKFKEPSSPTE